MILKAGGRLGMGGDYGFAWNPHGDYAKELTFFVKHVGFTPAGNDPLRHARPAPRSWAAQDEFGTLEAGKLADVLVVDGDVLADIALLEDRARFIAVMQGGHRQGRANWPAIRPPRPTDLPGRRQSFGQGPPAIKNEPHGRGAAAPCGPGAPEAPGCFVVEFRA